MNTVNANEESRRHLWVAVNNTTTTLDIDTKTNHGAVRIELRNGPVCQLQLIFSYESEWKKEKIWDRFCQK